MLFSIYLYSGNYIFSQTTVLYSYLLRLLNHCPGLHWCWPGVPRAPHLCPHYQSESGCLDLHRCNHMQDLTLYTVHSGGGQEWVYIAVGNHVAEQVNSVFVFIPHFAPVSVSLGFRLSRSSLFCRTAAFFSTTKQQTSIYETCPLSHKMRTCEAAWSICKYSPPPVPIPWVIPKPASIYCIWQKPESMSHSLAGGFSFSFFFFLHFQGLKMRPKLASLLLRRMGGVRTPETKQPECSALCWSIKSTTQNKRSSLNIGCRQQNPSWTRVSINAQMWWGLNVFLKSLLTQMAELLTHHHHVRVANVGHWLWMPYWFRSNFWGEARGQRIALFVCDSRCFREARPSWSQTHRQ